MSVVSWLQQTLLRYSPTADSRCLTATLSSLSLPTFSTSRHLECSRSRDTQEHS